MGTWPRRAVGIPIRFGGFHDHNCTSWRRKATQVRLEDPWFLFPVGIGVLIWGGLFLCDDRLRALIPVRS
jgi:hypothetical protein